MINFTIDEGGNYSQLIQSNRIRVISPPVISHDALIHSDTYMSSYDIDMDRLEAFDNNPADENFGTGGGTMYPIKISGLNIETFETRQYTPIISVTPYKNVETGEDAQLLMKTYYFMLFYDSNYFKVVKLIYAIMSKSKEDINYIRDNIVGLESEDGDNLMNYAPRLNTNTIGIYTNYDDYLYNVFTESVRMSKSTPKAGVLQALKNRNTKVLNTQLIMDEDDGRNFLSDCGVLFNPQMEINEPGWSAQEAKIMGLPIKSVIRNIDYLHNIDVYDETMRASRNMMLENYVGTSSYELVNYSSPSGVIRVKGLKNFTHFVGAGFGNGNMPRVYRVTSYKTIGADVVEYSFEIDYLKDFFQHYAIDEDHPLRTKSSTYMGDWDKSRTLGTEPLDTTTLFKKIYLSHNDNQNLARWLVCGRFAATSGGAIQQAVLLTDAQLIEMYRVLLESTSSEKIASCIDRIEYVCYQTVYSTTYVGPLTIGGETILSDGAIFVLPTEANTAPNTIRFQLYADVPPAMYENGMEFEAPAVLYIQGYGVVEMKSYLKQYIQLRHELQETMEIYMIENICTGETNIAIDAITDFNESSNLQMPIVTNSAPQQIRQFGFNAAFNIAGAGVAGAVGGLKMGGVKGAVGMGLAGAGITAGKSVFDYFTIMETVGPNMGTANGGTVYPGIFVATSVPTDTGFDLLTYYDSVGYPCNFKAGEGVEHAWLSGHRYTVDFIGNMMGTEEYGSACKEAIEGTYVVYNYLTAAGV